MLDKRLLFVTGKGGVGKTAVSIALALLAAGQGRRTLVCELEGNRRAQHVFAAEGDPSAETELAANLSAVSIDPQQAMEEYLRDRMHSQTISRLLFRNRLFEYLTAATPGMRELLTMGKLWEFAQLERRRADATAYDLVIVDAPATGHGLGLLEAPKTFRDAAGAGPIRSQADRIHSFIVDSRRTGIVAVCLAEELPVTETLELYDLLAQRMGIRTDMTVVNALHPERFATADIAAIEREHAANQSAVLAAALEASRFEHRRRLGQQAQLERLTQRPSAQNGQPRVVTLPEIFSSELDAGSFEYLAAELERQL